MVFHSSQEEKPYAFVPLPDRVNREKPAGHDGFKRGLLSGVIVGEIEALTPVHVASGSTELTNDNRVPLVKAHFRTGGNLAIPGSSLKGVIRNILEAITPSCVRVQSRAVRDRLPPGRGFEPCEIRDERSKLCPACRIFGAMGYQGQVRFADAVLVEGEFGTMLAPSLFAPRSYSQIYYDGEGYVKGRKFYFHGQPATGNVPLEVCAVASRFSLRIDFVNLTPSELGVLLTAMGRNSPPFALKLGGAKPACRGSVEVRIQSVETHDSISAAMEFDSRPITADTAHWLSTADSLLVRSNLEQLHRILHIDANRTCPSEGY